MKRICRTWVATFWLCLVVFSHPINAQTFVSWETDPLQCANNQDKGGDELSDAQRQFLRTTIEPTLSTKRPYHPPEVLPEHPKHCTLLHINHLGRHGSRYAKDDRTMTVEHFQPAKEIGLLDDPTARLTEKGELLRSILQQQQAFYTPEYSLAGEITAQGEQEQAGIAERLITGSGLSRATFLEQLMKRSGTARSTMVHRTHTSRAAFLESWKRALNSSYLNLNILTPAPGERDNELQFYRMCDLVANAWKPSVRNHQTEINSAVNDPENRKKFVTFANDFIFGLTPQQASSFASLAYHWCALDANQSYKLGLCKLFIQAPEYQTAFEANNERTSLAFFYGRGPVSELNHANRDSAIELLNSFLAKTDRAIIHPQASFVDLRFAHESTTLRFLQILGLVTYENSTDADGNIVWDLGALSPMATNIVWQTYSCNDGGEEPVHKVRMLVNERVTPFPITECQSDESGLCDWTTIKQYYRQHYAHVSVDSVCGENGGMDPQD